MGRPSLRPSSLASTLPSAFTGPAEPTVNSRIQGFTVSANLQASVAWVRRRLHACCAQQRRGRRSCGCCWGSLKAPHPRAVEVSLVCEGSVPVLGALEFHNAWANLGSWQLEHHHHVLYSSKAQDSGEPKRVKEAEELAKYQAARRYKAEHPDPAGRQPLGPHKAQETLMPGRHWPSPGPHRREQPGPFSTPSLGRSGPALGRPAPLCIFCLSLRLPLVWCLRPTRAALPP